MNGERTISGASVKVMRSYDYCHFEVCLSEDDAINLNAVDDLRKDAMRLVDKAVEQYKTAKASESKRLSHHSDAKRLKAKAKAIKENFPKSEWTPDQKATIKMYEDHCFHASRIYDYEDHWSDYPDDDSDW